VGKNTKIFQSGEKCEDFSKWFHCYGQPAQKWKKFEGGEKRKDFPKMVSLLWATGPNGR